MTRSDFEKALLIFLRLPTQRVVSINVQCEAGGPLTIEYFYHDDECFAAASDLGHVPAKYEIFEFGDRMIDWWYDGGYRLSESPSRLCQHFPVNRLTMARWWDFCGHTVGRRI